MDGAQAPAAEHARDPRASPVRSNPTGWRPGQSPRDSARGALRWNRDGLRDSTSRVGADASPRSRDWRHKAGGSEKAMSRRRRQRHRMRARGPVAAGIASAAVAVAGAVAYERGAQRRAHQRRFGLHGDAPLGPGLHRSLVARLDRTITALENGHGDRVEAVHDARKSIKRIRTVLRLARSQIGERRYRNENDALRSVSEHLASLRDATAMPTVLEGLLDRRRDDVDADEIARLRSRVAARGEAAQGDAAETSVAAALTALRAVRARVDDWPLTREEAPLKPILDGFQRAYTRAQKGYRRAHDHPTTEALHESRKRVKDVRYGAELLRDADP